jgi:hypothetical protein|tara:strand:+ start:357 stop:1193 length:837 start_codon:yes stop_codon:yes gene_type:complete
MKEKTIILLAPKRCGTTALFNVFKNHTQVKISHHDQEIENWEPQFWNLAMLAINGKPNQFILRMKNTFPKIVYKKPFNKKKIFSLWSKILKVYGPCIFDKSPQYLNDYKVLQLIYEYKQKGNDVRFISMIRNPRDAITSQYELWKEHTGEISLKKREKKWLSHIINIEKFNEKVSFPIYRYEDIANNKKIYFKKIFEECDLRFEKKSFKLFKPVSINRFHKIFNKKIKQWSPGKKFKLHMIKYGYNTDKINFSYFQKIKFFLQNIKRLIPNRYKSIIK